MSTIGFIGAGNMGLPLIKAVCKKVDATQVVACDHHPERLAALVEEKGLVMADTAAQVAEQSEFVVVGIKPHAITGLLEDIAPALKAACAEGRTPVLCSLAAGYSLKEFDRVLGGLGLILPIVRLMPNSGVGIGEGVCLFAANSRIEATDLERLMGFFEAAGLCEAVDEDTLARSIPIFSCSPAYVYMFIESLADAGSELGLERDLAMRLAAQAVKGSAANVLESDKHVAALRDEICTPRGMTITATNRMEKAGFRSAVIEGALAAYEHSKNMLD